MLHQQAPALVAWRQARPVLAARAEQQGPGLLRSLGSPQAPPIRPAAVSTWS
jgi:hypothetical protein